MFWRDAEDDGGIEGDVPVGRTPGLTLECARSRRLRLSIGAQRLLWAYVVRGTYGVWTLRPDHTTPTSPAIVDPIRADDARRIRGTDGWMRWFAAALDRSGHSPLRAGTWRLTELRAVPPPPHQRIGPDRFTSPATRLPPEAYDLRASLQLPRLHYESWGINGSDAVLPLRLPSAPDDGRVKSWRKHARDNTLPPILLWWVGGLQMYVILDGHDRLLAACEERINPQVIALWQPLSEGGDGFVPDALAALYEEIFAKAEAASHRESTRPDEPIWVEGETRRAVDVSPMARVRLNRWLVSCFQPQKRPTTGATARALAEDWVAEVRDALPDGEDDCEMLIDERPRQDDELTDLIATPTTRAEPTDPS